MRLALVETSAHGGLLHYAVQLGDALARRGHEVDLLTPRDNELASRPIAARMRAELPRPTKSILPPRNRFAYFLRRAGIAGRLARAWGRILWRTRTGGYDAVIVNCDITLPPVTFAASLLTLGGRGPAITDVCHNVRPFNHSTGEIFDASPAMKKGLSRMYPRFDLVFLHGDRARAEFEEVWPPARLAVIPHGDERIFADEPPPPATEKRILFFGDLRKNKGLFVLKDAFELLSQRVPDARLTIAGTPAPSDLDPDPLIRWAESKDGHVTILPRYTPVEEVPALFGSARVVTTPYLAGYQSGVVHLAMTMGRPVVTTDVGDLATAVGDERGGLVVPPGDAAALAGALERVLTDPELAERLGAGAREKVLSGSSWETVAERVEHALLDLPKLAGTERSLSTLAH